MPQGTCLAHAWVQLQAAEVKREQRELEEGVSGFGEAWNTKYRHMKSVGALPHGACRSHAHLVLAFATFSRFGTGNCPRGSR